MHQWLINWQTPRRDYLRPLAQLRLTVSPLQWRIPIYRYYRRLRRQRLIWLIKRPPHRLAINKQVITSYRRLRTLSSPWWDRIQATRHPPPINWPRRNSRSARFHLLNSSNSNSRSNNKPHNRPVKEPHRRHGISQLLPVAVESICRVRQVCSNIMPTALILIKHFLALIVRRAFNNHLDRRHNPSGIKVYNLKVINFKLVRWRFASL